MKKSTKAALWVGSVVGGVWAWMKFGNRATIAASRVVTPGYTSTRYLTDGNGKQIAMQFIYPAVPGTNVVKTFTVPIDPNGRGYWGTLRA